jgi:DNA-directed RNA polymerase specialized sigma24 family protein
MTEEENLRRHTDSSAVLMSDAEIDVAHKVGEIARRDADWRLVVLARSHPKALDRLRDKLIAYAMPRVEAKIASHAMWREAHGIGIPAPAPTPPVLEPEEIESLAAEVVARAFTRFRKYGLQRWDPKGGVALTTWFFRDCLHQFANAVRAWSTDRRELAPSLSCLLGLDEPNLSQLDYRPAFSDSVSPGTEAAALASVGLDSRLRDIELRLGTEMRRIAEEHFVKQRPLTDVAREMGMTPQRAHRLVRRCRKVMIQVWGEESSSE